MKLTQRRRRKRRRMMRCLTQKYVNEARLRGDLVVCDAQGRVTSIVRVRRIEMDTS